MSVLARTRRLLSSSLTGLSAHEASDAAVRALGELSGAGVLGALVDELVGDAEGRPEGDAAARALLSYRHPLGFRKITLLIDEPVYTLRAHVWPAGETTAEHIHNHRFGLASYVVHGGMTMRLYAATDDAESEGVPMARYREEPGTRTAEGWRLRKVGTAAVRRTAELRLAPGTQYWLASDVLHQIVPQGADPTVTLFLETLSVRSRTEVYAPPEAAVPGWIPRQALGVGEHVKELEELRGFPGFR